MNGHHLLFLVGVLSMKYRMSLGNSLKGKMLTKIHSGVKHLDQQIYDVTATVVNVR